MSTTNTTTNGTIATDAEKASAAHQNMTPLGVVGVIVTALAAVTAGWILLSPETFGVLTQLFTLTALAGAFGGLVSYFGFSSSWFRRRQRERIKDGPLLPDDGEVDLNWYQPVIRGIGAAFLVPLFLKIVESKVLAPVSQNGASAQDEHLFVYAGLCLVASISSRAFISSISQRVLEQAKQAAQTAENAQQTARQAQTNVQETQEDLQKTRNDVRTIATMNPEITPVGGPQPISRGEAKSARGMDGLSDLYNQDPNKGKFGGEPERDGFSLGAAVTRYDDSSLFFEVRLTITAAAEIELKSPDVRVHLHPTFSQSERTLTLDADRKAEITLLSMGAFTVGVEANNGATRLELDLADPRLVPGAPQEFRER